MARLLRQTGFFCWRHNLGFSNSRSRTPGLPGFPGLKLETQGTRHFCSTAFEGIVFSGHGLESSHHQRKTPVMISKLSLLAALLFPLSFLSAQQSPYEMHRQVAIQVNEMAGHIASPDDARRLVDRIAGIFANELPPEWSTRGIRRRIAQAEFESATDPSKLISEEQIADAWNRYVTEIGAGDRS